MTKIYSANKIVKVYASVSTENGYYHVYEDGIVERWSDAVNDWYSYRGEEYDDVFAAGLKVLGV